MWEGGRCTFHKHRVCSCSKCPKERDAEPECDGTPYKTKYRLTCPFHAHLYERECQYRAQMAYQIIHPELGAGHSNSPESFWSIVIRYRNKAVDLHKLSYEVTTNLGFLHANQTFMSSVKGEKYNFKIELLEACGIKIPETVRLALEKEAEERTKSVKKMATEVEKKKKAARKGARLKQAVIRKKWQAEGKVLHDYHGSQVENDSEAEDDECEDDEDEDSLAPYLFELPETMGLDEEEMRGVINKPLKSISKRTLLCFMDIEATGKYCDREDTTQLAAQNVVLDNNLLVPCEEKFNTYVKTLRRMSPEAQRITGILPFRAPNSPLKTAPEFDSAMGSWVTWIAEQAEKYTCATIILVGHNIRAFDLRLLINQGNRLSVDVPRLLASKKIVYLLDTLSLLRKNKETVTWPHDLLLTAGGCKSLSMASIFKASFDEAPPNAHQADGDVEALIRVATADHIRGVLLDTTLVQGIPTLLDDMAKKRKKVKEMALEIIQTRTSGKRKATEEATEEAEGEGNSNKRKKCVCGYIRHPKTSECPLKPK